MKRPFLLSLIISILFMPPSMPEEISWSPWAKSSDKQISVRLGTAQRLYAGKQPTKLCMSIRNDSGRNLDTLAPWGDWFFALASGLKVTRDGQPVIYCGPMKEYVLGRNSFCTIEPGKIVEKCVDFDQTESQLDLTTPGKYSVRITYYSTALAYQKMSGSFKFGNPWEGTVEISPLSFERVTELR